MPKDDLVYVGHMFDMAIKAVEKLSGVTRGEFDADENLRMALAHIIQVIGEAASHVSPEFRENHQGIPWRAIIGMRNKIVHDYMHVDFDIVWDVAAVELPPLIPNLEKLLPP
jgi:uncharacterized protein with HEPN domain